MIYYGQENSHQSYGGGSIVLNTLASKPCFMPVYLFEKLESIVYMHCDYYSKKIVLKQQTGTTDLKFILWYR